MHILISPAKKMAADTDSLPCEALPQFLPEAEQLHAALAALSPAQLQALWQCSDALARSSLTQLRGMDLHRRLTPAILAYDGIQYRTMAPGVFTWDEFDYLRAHLRILSGLYGLLRPFDGVTPYRLEMQAKLAAGGAADLYAFWGARLAAQLCAETDCLLNLASKEYSRAVEPHLQPGVRFVTVRFCERAGEKLVEKATLCKMARGRMVRWMAENSVETPEELPAFAESGWRYSAADSAPDTLVFLRGALRARG